MTAVWETPNHDDWLGLSARMRDFVQIAAGRTDLITVVTPDDTQVPAPASFVPSLAEVRFKASASMTVGVTDPATIDPARPQDREQWGHLIGLGVHEAAHAAHTRWAPPSDANGAAVRWATLLEEPRIEGRLVQDRPVYRKWLEKACRTHQLQDIPIGEPNQLDPARATVLVLGRAHLGLLPDALVEQVALLCRDALGNDVVDAVLVIVDEAMTFDDTDGPAMVDAGQQIADLLGDTNDSPDTKDGGQQSEQSRRDPAKDEASSDGDGDDESADDGDDGESANGNGDGESEAEAPGDGEDGEPEDGGAGGSEDGSEGEDGQQGASSGDEADAEAAGGGAGEPATGDGKAAQLPCGSWTAGDLPDDANPWQTPPDGGKQQDGPSGDVTGESSLSRALRDISGEVSDQRELRASDATRQPERVVEDSVRAAIGKATQQVFGGTNSTPIKYETYAPDGQLLTETRQVIAMLRRAEYRGSDVTRRRSVAPPGRLRTGELMQRDAQIALGLRVHAEPWKQTQRREILQPRLRLGISSDVSGSMQNYQRGVARLGYAMTHAVRVLNGTVASVAWNSTAAAMIHPGAVPNEVIEAKCGGGSGGCSTSLHALDGALDLTTDTTPVRVVVIVTDGQITNRDQAVETITRLCRMGVRVLVATPTECSWVPDPASNVLVRPPEGDGMGVFGAVLGQAIADVLSAA